MWIARTHYEYLFRQLCETRDKLVAAERLDAAHTATIEWLRLHVNRLEAERALLVQRILQVPFPVPEIAREPAAPPATGAPGETVTGLPVVDTEHGLPDDAIAVAQMLSGMMEDVGDAAAKTLGIGHTPDGQIQYLK